MGKTAQILTSIQTEIEMHLRQEYYFVEVQLWSLVCGFTNSQILFDVGIMFINFH